MKTICIATTNKGKVHSAKDALRPFHIDVIHICIDLPEIRSEDLHEIARVKALAAYQKIKKPVIAIDSGFFLDALNGFPGSFTAYTLKTIGLRGLLRLLRGKKRTGEFRNVLAYYDGVLKTPRCFESRVRGTLAHKPRGGDKPRAWSDLHKIFITKGTTKTASQMTEEEYRVYREKRKNQSFLTKFARWYTKR